MKKIIFILPFLALIVPMQVMASCPWYDPFCTTPTPSPTPTPTPVIFQMAPLKTDLFKVIGTVTPTPTVTSTPSPTVTMTPTATVTIEPTVTETPMTSETPEISPITTPTPEMPKTIVGGFTARETAFGALVVFVLLLLIVQANWGKIKIWLHRKTE